MAQGSLLDELKASGGTEDEDDQLLRLLVGRRGIRSRRVRRSILGT